MTKYHLSNDVIYNCITTYNRHSFFLSITLFCTIIIAPQTVYILQMSLGFKYALVHFIELRTTYRLNKNKDLGIIYILER